MFSNFRWLSDGSAAVLTLLLISVSTLAGLGGCTIEDIEDEISVTEVIPSNSGNAFEIRRTLGLGDDTDAVDQGTFTGVSLRVVTPEPADLFQFLSIDLFINDTETPLASGTDFLEGERSRDLTVLYTADIKPLLASGELELIWRVRYKTSATISDIELETVVGFNIDVVIL